MIAALLLAALEIPAGAAPVVDGKVGAAEWKDAAVLGEEKGITVRAKHDAGALYLSVEQSHPCTGNEEMRLILGSGEAGTGPGEKDLELSFAPFSMQRMPWQEERGDGKSWVPLGSPKGWTARADATEGERMQFEMAVSLSRIPEGELRLGVLCDAGQRSLSWPRDMNLYTPSTWAGVRLAGARGKPAEFDLASTLAKAKEAREAFQTAMTRFQELQKRKEAPKTRSEALTLQQSLEAAAKGFSKAAELEKDNPLARFAYGGFLASLGETDAGRDELLAARRLAPSVPRLAERLYQLDVQANRYADALALAEEGVKAVPDSPGGWILRGQARLCLGDFDGAERDLEKAVRMPIDSQAAKFVEGLLAEAKALKAAWPEEEKARRQGDTLPRAQLVLERGTILVELFEDDAPNTVANFVSLAERGFFDGTRFHRVIGDFMAQGGDPLSRDPDAQGVGSGGPGYRIRTQTGARKHWRGTLSMANSGPDTDGSQFFITVKPTRHLDGKHAVFGRVLEGQEVVDGIRPGDVLKSVRIVRKRAHEYVPEKYEGEAAKP